MHGARIPQAQLPAAVQLSERPSAVQSVHARPFEPHVAGARARQTLPEQHPSGHEVASHAHAPPTQCWPGAQAAPPPQVHAPRAQPSAPTPHVTHELPVAPHAIAVGGEVQVEPEQHPPGHVDALQLAHTPDAHVPEAQLVHAAPPVPHALDDVPAMHELPWQQPLHEDGSHTHAPPEHRCPAPHAGPAPQVQAPSVEQPSPAPPREQSTQLTPPVPQVSVARGAHAVPMQQPEGQELTSHVHAPLTQRWPEAHGGPEPQEHTPRVQPSDRRSQVTQAAAPVPHALAVGGVHAAPLQHPLAQVAALQLLQVPALHVSPALHAVHALPPEPQALALLPDVHSSPLQHPAHEVASHLHAPPTQRWPAAQAGPAPQLQAPAPSQPSAVVASHAMHWAPGAPHALVPVARHAVPAQHPAAHEVASQTHAPRRQRCPTAQAPPPPQLHSPLGVHRSASVTSHAVQIRPAAAQVAVVSGRHVSPSQQPVGHEVASHVQAPPAQCWPGAHTAPAPHAQPAPAHPSARTGSHAKHAAPPIPQLPTLGTLQLAPEQQPPGQPAAHPVQTPAAQLPVPQGSHAPPPLPHIASASPARHVVPSQQPAHEVASQMQAPPAQCCPGAHAAPAPHRQRPAAHPSAVVGSHAAQLPPAGPQLANEIGEHVSPSQHPDAQDAGSQTQRPDAQRCPGRHAGPVPQPHVPVPEHASASVGSHAMQLAPPDPHVPSARSRQLAPSQHPAVHDDASQMQRPVTQCCPPAHGGPSPHAHVPSRAHASARIESQTRHVAPAAPHAAAELSTQLEPEQQPDAHELASHPEHAPPEHVSPAGQAVHA